MKGGLFLSFRFGTVGAVATATHGLVAFVGLQIMLSPYLANLAGFAAAFGVGFFGHLLFSFRHRAVRWRTALVRYAVLSGASFLIATGLLDQMVRHLVLPSWLAVGGAVASMAAINFILSTLWAFADRCGSLENGVLGDNKAMPVDFNQISY